MSKKVIKALILTYYWPPSGGSGVQRWLYFTKYLNEFDVEPIVVTVDEKYASYKFIDASFLKKVEHVLVHKTKTREPFKIYSSAVGGKLEKNIPQGFAGESDPGFIKKFARMIRGNFFIPDARKGWNSFALEKARELIREQGIEVVVSTGPPHSTHLIGLKLKKEFGLKWIADFRDPWTEAYYNKSLYRSARAERIDANLENEVLQNADSILTVGPSMQKLLANKLPSKVQDKVRFIYNGFNPEDFKDIKKVKSPGRFIVSHIGMLSDSQPIDAFLKSMKNLMTSHPDAVAKIQLRWIGQVSPNIIERTRTVLPELDLEVIDYIPHHKALEEMMNADLLLNSFAEMPGSEILISGKLMEYLATGNPILCLGNSKGDAAQLLIGTALSRVFDRSDVNGITNQLEKIYLNWHSEKLESQENYERFSRRNTTQELANLIHTL